MTAPNTSLTPIVAEALKLSDPTLRAAYLERVCGNDPALRESVSASLAAHEQSDSLPTSDCDTRNLGPVQPLSGVRTVDDPHANFSHRGEADLPPSDVPGDRAVGTIIAGRYTLVELIGEGGMGSVYRADQTEPVRRQVALKVIKAGLDSRKVLARFEAERQALALMDHPNIARVYDGGTTELGQPFFVMELVKGLSLTRFCDDRRLAVKARLELFIAVCQAVQHAHQKGIIHRDLKPSNVLVVEVDGKPTPKVIDFGIAKATDHKLIDQTLAETGLIVGTPTHMSPEQTDPGSMDIDTRTDVYSLGVMLYELLVGCPPIDLRHCKSGDIWEMVRLIREVEPLRPSVRLNSVKDVPALAAKRDIEPARLARLLRGELDWVVMKALEKDRTRRYETANGLARDLQRYLADELVEARPPSAGYRIKKYVRRHRGAVLAAALILLVLVVGMVGTTLGLIEARQQRNLAHEEADAKTQALLAEAERVKERDAALATARTNAQAAQEQTRRAEANLTKAKRAEQEATEERKRADNAAEVTRQNLYYAEMHLAQQAWRENRGLPHMRELLANWLPRREEVRRPEWGLSQVRDLLADWLTGPTDRRGWEWFYLHSLPSQNLRTLTERGKGNRHTAIVAWHVPTKRLAQATADGLIRIWDVEREETTLTLQGPAAVNVFWGGRWLAWSPDGARIAAGFADGSVRVWDAGTGKEIHVLRGHQARIYVVEFSKDGTRLASWGEDGVIKLRDAGTGKLHAEVQHPGAVRAGAWSLDGKHLATGHQDGSVTLSGTQAEDKVVTIRGHDDLICQLAWSPDSTRLASASADFTTKVWEVATSKMVLGPLRHSHGVAALAWEPEGQRLATGSCDQTVKIWDTATGQETATLRGHDETIASLSWGPNNQLASGCDYGSARIWNALEDQEARRLPAHDGRATAVAWSPDGKRLASAGNDGAVRIWDPVSRKELLKLKGHDPNHILPQFGLIRSLAWSPDGAYLASAGLDNTARVWEVASGRPLFALPTVRGAVWSVAWSPDGTRLAAGSQDGTIRVVTSPKEKPRIRVFKAHEPQVFGTGGEHGVRALTWSPAGDRLASVGVDGSVKVWDPLLGAELVRLEGHQSWGLSVAWSPDGKRLASSGVFLAITWDARTGRKLKTMRGHHDFVDAVAWSPDGTRLASASLDNSVRIWDPETGAETFVLRGISGWFHDVAWSPDGAQLAAASSDGHIWIWDATRGFERDITARALPHIGRKLASGTARGEDLVRFAESYLRAGKPREALAAAQDHVGGLIMLYRHFSEQGNTTLANEAHGKARTLLEKRLAANPDNAGAAADLANLLLAGSRGSWKLLKPTRVQSARGATLTPQADGSILASGTDSLGDVYTVHGVSDLDRIVAFRLEVLPDPSLPNKGPGRHPSGNFHLSAFRLYQGSGAGRTHVPLERAWASFAYQAWDSDVAGTVNERLNKTWHVWGRCGEEHQAFFLLGDSAAVMGRGTTHIELAHRKWNKSDGPVNLGRFRLSVTDDRSVLDTEQKRQAALALTNPWARLAAGYHLLGAQLVVDGIVKRHPAAGVGLGDLHAAVQDWEQALGEYRKAIKAQPTDVTVLRRLAEVFQAQGHTREAVPLLATLSAQQPADTLLSLRVAALQAWFGQDKELAATRQRVLAFTRTNNEFFTAERAAKAFSLVPATDKAVLDTGLALAREGAKVGRNGSWHLMTLGMAEYRAGNHRAAEQALTAAASSDPRNLFITETCACYRAMLLFRQGKTDEARQLARATAMKMPQLPGDENNPLADDANHDHLILWLAYREAKALLKIEPPPVENK